jgi:RHS repeat-associated protein
MSVPASPDRSAWRVGRGRLTFACMLFALGAFLCHFGVSPAYSQMGGHMHVWVPGAAPDGYMEVRHLDGPLVSDTAPALPCEVLSIAAVSVMDGDTCVGEGLCPLGNSIQDLSLQLGRWDDFGALGHFVTWNGHASNDEATDPVTGHLYGSVGVSYYRVADDQPDNTRISLSYEISNNGSAYAPDGTTWATSQSFLVRGTKCWIPTGRTVGPEENAACVLYNSLPGNSTISPSNGNVHFEVPITSWGYRGLRLGFSLYYNSQSVVDHGRSFHQLKHPAALSDDNIDAGYNPKWSCSFAEWIEVLDNGTAVWNRADGSQTTFSKSGPPEAPLWTSEDSYLTLTSTGEATSPQFKHEDYLTTVKVPFASFTLKDSQGNTYTFDDVVWRTSDHPPFADSYAIPYFRLRSVSDRWSRTVYVNWDHSTSDKGILSVRDGANRGLTFNYTQAGSYPPNPPIFLISSITDPAGRTHLLNHGATGGQRKLTGATVYGAGSPNRATYAWSFGYGGQFNDLVTQKWEPTGKVAYYEHAPVANPRASASDWDGRLGRTYFYDDLENPAAPVLREITRSGGTLIYPGGDSYTYTYTGDHLTGVTRNATGMSAGWEYDGQANLVAAWTGMETSASPLVRYQYSYGGVTGKQITAVTATDILGNKADALYNTLGLPTQIRALATAGSGHADQVTDLTYDNGALSFGNITHIVAALGTASEEAADLSYLDSTRPALPTGVVDGVGGQSGAAYYPDGSPSSATGPANLLAPAGDADRSASTATFGQNADELPSYVISPTGHRVNVTYNAAAPGSSELIVTFTDTADNTTRKITLDGAGRVIKSVDDRGITTLIDYGRGGQVLKVAENSTAASPRVTTFAYGPHEELVSVTPAGGGTIRFEYNRYLQGFGGGAPILASPAVYEGQLTRVIYGDGTSAYQGFNSAGELIWRCDAAGRYTTYHRDSLHRVYQVDYPATSQFGAITLSKTFDEFGRATQFSDQNGTTTYSFDDLNRTVSVAPAVGSGVTYQYVKDFANARRTVKVTLSGTGTWEYGADGKGRLAQVLNPYGQLATRSFAPDGKALREVKPNGTVTDYAYTTRDWLANIQHRLSDTSVLDNFQYLYTNASGVYDKKGRLQREVDKNGVTHTYTYTNFDELATETHPDLNTGENYYYSANGNRTRRLLNGVNLYCNFDNHNKLLSASPSTGGIPSNGQITPYRKYTYDQTGRPTQLEHRDVAGGPVVTELYDWDGMGKLRRIRDLATGATLYSATYAGNGARVTATIGGVTHTYHYAGGLKRDDAGASSTVYTTGVSQRQNGVDRFFHSDRQGSTRYLTDATGLAAPTAYRFDGYGQPTWSSGPDSTNRKYAGGYRYQADVPGGLSQIGNRLYDPVVGRFLSPDQTGLAGGLNQYQYVGSDPMQRVDPSGNEGSWLGKGGGARWLDEDDGSPAYDNQYTTNLTVRDQLGVPTAMKI